MKELKTTDELIEHLKRKGCGFNIVTEEEAKQFLQKSSYYMKLASFRANYDKIEAGKNVGKYKKLEFAYLKELSTLDMRLRYIIMHMCADIEHSIRRKLINDMEYNDEEDGYKGVKLFIEEHEGVLNMLNRNRKSEYCKQLIDKYNPDYPIWVFVELISFSTLASLCNFYNKMYGVNFLNMSTKLLNSVRDLRNASAHHNCLMVNLRKGGNVPLHEITDYVSLVEGIGKIARKNRLSNRFLNDFVTLVYVHRLVVDSRQIRINRMGELKKFTDERMYEHSDYFENNEIVKSSFLFMKRIVDYTFNEITQCNK